jgi:hypothetical protein
MLDHEDGGSRLALGFTDFLIHWILRAVFLELEGDYSGPEVNNV